MLWLRHRRASFLTSFYSSMNICLPFFQYHLHRLQVVYKTDWFSRVTRPLYSSIARVFVFEPCFSQYEQNFYPLTLYSTLFLNLSEIFFAFFKRTSAAPSIGFPRLPHRPDERSIPQEEVCFTSRSPICYCHRYVPALSSTAFSTIGFSLTDPFGACFHAFLLGTVLQLLSWQVASRISSRAGYSIVNEHEGKSALSLYSTLFLKFTDIFCRFLQIVYKQHFIKVTSLLYLEQKTFWTIISNRIYRLFTLPHLYCPWSLSNVTIALATLFSSLVRLSLPLAKSLSSVIIMSQQQNRVGGGD